MTRPLVLLALLVAFAGCDEGNPPPLLIGAALDSAIESTFSLIDASALQQDVAELASDEYGGRNAGYPGELMAARYLATQMEQAGLAPMGDELGSESTYFQRFDFHPRWPTEPWEVLSSQNVLGFLEGSDPDLKHEIVVLGAHYDGQGQAGEADPDRWPSKDPLSVPDTIWNSADDNASGAAVVLAVARALSLNRPLLRRSILFAEFGAEEPALIGSVYYVGHPVFEWDRHVAMLNLEKLGRKPDQRPVVVTDGTSPMWPGAVERANAVTRTMVSSFLPDIIRDTDHYPFAARGLPAMVYAMVHEDDTHRPTDSWDKIDYDRLAERARYVLALTVHVANLPDRPTFNYDILTPDPGLLLATATDAELAARGIGATQGGLKVVAVLVGLPGDRADLRIGDLIVAVDGNALSPQPSTDLLVEMMSEQSHRSISLQVLRGQTRLQLALSAEGEFPRP